MRGGAGGGDGSGGDGSGGEGGGGKGGGGEGGGGEGGGGEGDRRRRRAFAQPQTCTSPHVVPIMLANQPTEMPAPTAFLKTMSLSAAQTSAPSAKTMPSGMLPSTRLPHNLMGGRGAPRYFGFKDRINSTRNAEPTA